MIETGRYNQTSRNDRFCPICNSGIIEDEFHFLFHCPKYSIPREKFYNQIQQNFVDFNQLSYTELIIKLMNSQNFSVNSNLLKFVSLCNDLRNNLLSNHADDTWLTIGIIALHYHYYDLFVCLFFFTLKLLQYCNYIIIVMQIKLMLLLLLLLLCPLLALFQIGGHVEYVCVSNYQFRLLQIATVITMCQKYYKLQQYPRWQTEPADIQYNFKFSLDLFLSPNGKIQLANKTKKTCT